MMENDAYIDIDVLFKKISIPGKSSRSINTIKYDVYKTLLDVILMEEDNTSNNNLNKTISYNTLVRNGIIKKNSINID